VHVPASRALYHKHNRCKAWKREALLSFGLYLLLKAIEKHTESVKKRWYKFLGCLVDEDLFQVSNNNTLFCWLRLAKLISKILV
jgi:hypothetical protein